MEITTPMMQQWAKIKSKYKDFIVFYRLGDFYEMFEEDAHIASSILNLALTSRNGHPMCGVPYHSYKIYLKKLITSGKKVVICEQLEDPSKAKGMVKRGVTEVITPGTLIESDFLSSDNNFITCIYIENKAASICWTDVSIGEFYCSEIKLKGEEREDFDQIYTFLEKIKPSEIIIAEKNNILKNLSKRFFVTVLSQSYYEGNDFENLLNSFFSVHSIEDFGIKSLNLKKTINAMVLYLKENEINIKPKLSKIDLLDNNEYLSIDSRTIHNLEIFEPFLPIDKTFTLFSCINQTKTSMGRRLLRKWLTFPIRNEIELKDRYFLVQKFIEAKIINTIGEQLTKIFDIERIFTKIIAKKANAMDLINLKYSIIYARSMQLILEDAGLEILKVDDIVLSILNLIENSIVENPGSDFEQQVIKKGYNKELDQLFQLSNNVTDLLTDYQEELKRLSSIQNLKIKYNKIFGYFIEVSKGNIDKVPSFFIRKQTLVNNERYTTEKLLELETKISSATAEYKELQRSIFESILDEISKYNEDGLKLSSTIAYIDVIYSFSFIATKYHWVMPHINSESVISIEDGRHPVLDIIMGKECISNDLQMDENKFFHIITGPNMSGKSTYLRQSALILYLAHIGSFVPAKSCNFFILDAIYSRIGASDNIATGQSTFFVEMNETAKILNFATNKSFVILDEVGRGTATFDGMSLAYSICEHLLTDIKCYTLFATHYHELTLLEDEYNEVTNFHMQVSEWEEKIIFLKKCIKGYSDKSYGIYVASLAAIPQKVIERAKTILEILSENEIVFEKKQKVTSKDKKIKEKETLFDDSIEPLLNLSEKLIVEKLKLININELTPVQALNILSELKDLLKP